jgi:hypothetical protein
MPKTLEWINGEPVVREMTKEEIAALAPTEDQVRAQRDTLLVESDWTQLKDAPVDQVAWAAYRQALRDIPSQKGFPASVVWPDKPV